MIRPNLNPNMTSSGKPQHRCEDQQPYRTHHTHTNSTCIKSSSIELDSRKAAPQTIRKILSRSGDNKAVTPPRQRRHPLRLGVVRPPRQPSKRRQRGRPEQRQRCRVYAVAPPQVQHAKGRRAARRAHDGGHGGAREFAATRQPQILLAGQKSKIGMLLANEEHRGWKLMLVT